MGEFAALLVIAMLPVAVPAAAGSKVTASVAFCPLERIAPDACPLALNPAPATTILEIVTLAFPVLVNVTFWELLFDTVTLPNATVVELLLKFPELGGGACVTVSTAAPLVALPTIFVTTTVKFAELSDVVVTGVV